MLIKNNGTAPITMNLRDGTSYLLQPGVTTSVPDAATAMIDDSPVLIALFNAGTLTVTTDAGGAFAGFPTVVNGTDSAVGKLLNVRAKVGAGGARTLVDETGQPVGSGGGGLLPEYVGVVASRCGNCDSKGGVNQMDGTIIHRAYGRLTSLTFWDSARIQEGQPIGGNFTIQRAVEYPLGTAPQRVKWGGGNSGFVADGTDVASDELTLAVAIPDGALFATHYFVDSTAGIPFATLPNSAMSALGERSAIGNSVTNTVDTGTGSKAGNTSQYIYKPALILAKTTRPTILLCGDSRQFGNADGTTGTLPGGLNLYGFKGCAELRLGLSVATSNFARGGRSLYSFDTQAKRDWIKWLAGYHSHVYSNLGTNDFGQTAATNLAQVDVVAGYFDKPVFWETCYPTQAAESGALLTNRQGFNSGLLAGRRSLAGVIDAASVLEGSTPGTWVAGTTDDNLHANNTGRTALFKADIWWPLPFIR